MPPTPPAKAPYRQPNFDPRIYNRTTFVRGRETGDTQDTDVNPNASSRLSRGFIRQSKPMPGFSDVAYLYFLYNPSIVSANYQVQLEQGAALAYPNPGDTGDPLLPINQTVEFSLLFDRTFELWDEKYIDTEVGKKGVQVDILAMKQLVGMTTTLDGVKAPTSTTEDDGGGEAAGGGDFPQAKSSDVMRAVQAWVHIGGRDALTYFGYITNWMVQYTHWSQYMVPYRAVINIGFQLLPSQIGKKQVPGTPGAKGTKLPDGTPSPRSLHENRLPSPGDRAGR